MTAAHQYAEEGNYAISISVQDKGGSSTTLNTSALVHDASLTPGTATAKLSTEGLSSSTLTATFSDANTSAPTSDFSGMIDWGDGTSTSPDTTPFTSSAVSGSLGKYTVTAVHQYVEHGTYPITITVSDKGGSASSMNAAAVVSDAPIHLAAVSLSSLPNGKADNLLLATLSDDNPHAATNEFSATIDWGDGQTTSGTVAPLGSPETGFGIRGTHQYTGSATYTLKVTVADKGGSSDTLTEQVTAAQSSTQQYVTAVYEDVLGRAPEPIGLNYWSGLLDSGTPITAVATAITHSAEYYANFVIRPAYLKLLGREADQDGVNFWTQQMLNGMTDQELQAGLVASDEFYATAGGTDKAWVDAVYKVLLGRDADASGEQYWTTLLHDGASRQQVALAIANSAENNTQLINADYEHYLGRAADPDGLNYWLSQFAAGHTNEDIIAGFTGSAEYYREHTS